MTETKQYISSPNARSGETKGELSYVQHKIEWDAVERGGKIVVPIIVNGIEVKRMGPFETKESAHAWCKEHAFAIGYSIVQGLMSGMEAAGKPEIITEQPIGGSTEAEIEVRLKLKGHEADSEG